MNHTEGILQAFTVRTIAAALLVAAGLAATWATPAQAADRFTVGSIVVEQPWARASAGPVKTGATYLVLVNTGTDADRLIAADSAVSERAELHTHTMDDGVMRMRQVDAIEVSPGTPTVLEPGGLHIMLMGLKKPLEEGESFRMTLTFETAGDVAIDIPVAGVGAMEPPAAGNR